MLKWSQNICAISGLPVLPLIRTFYLLSELSFLLASIPLPVYNFVCFTSILFFYSFDYTGLGLVGFWSRSHKTLLFRSHSLWSRSRCLRVAASTRVLEYYSSSKLVEYSLISISGCKFPNCRFNNPIQSNPIFIVKTQLTERSRITDKHSENYIKKHREHWEREKKLWECR